MPVLRRPRARADFPFHAGDPVLLRGRDWLIVLLSVAMALGLLVAPQLRLGDRWGVFLPALLFCGVPLAGLALVAGRRWTALFHRLSLGQVGWMVGIALLNLAITLLLGWAVSGTSHHLSPNPVFGLLAASDASGQLIRLAAMVPQLLGEELFTILPFLACLWLLHTRLRMDRAASVIAAWLLSSIPFALIHLPTYDWNLLQCLVVIGGARLVLSLAYLATRNLWVSTGAHVLNDWALFGFALWASHLS